MRISKSVAAILLCSIAVLIGTKASAADDILSKLQAAKQKAARQTYVLQYKFRPGETIRHKVVHRTTTETRVGKTTDQIQTRSISTKAWKVKDVDEKGIATFVHMVDDVDMWNHITTTTPKRTIREGTRPGKKEVVEAPIRRTQETRFNSQRDEKPPLGYESVAENIGIPLTTITIDPYGEMLKREDREGYSGIRGERLVVRLPPQPVAIGARWSCPHEIILRDQSGRYHRVNTRKVYELEKVSAAVAYIRVETQVLTPIHSPALKGQLVKWLTSGVIKFDIDAGRVISQEMNLDEKVIGFNGADSMMEYLAQWTEKLVPADEKTASSKTDESR
jgi:hypothetical protein